MATASTQLSVESGSTAVVYAVAEETRADPIDLPPLSDVLDPDALDAIVESWTSAGASVGRVSFTYHGYAVTVHGTGRIDVQCASDR